MKKLVHISMPNSLPEETEPIKKMISNAQDEKIFDGYEFIFTCGQQVEVTVDATPVLEEILKILRQIQINTNPVKGFVGDSHFSQ